MRFKPSGRNYLVSRTSWFAGKPITFCLPNSIDKNISINITHCWPMKLNKYYGCGVVPNNMWITYTLY